MGNVAFSTLCTSELAAESGIALWGKCCLFSLEIVAHRLWTAGVPVWWKTTMVNRPELPTKEIQVLSESVIAHPIRLPVEVTLVIVGDQPNKYNFCARQGLLKSIAKFNRIACIRISYNSRYFRQLFCFTTAKLFALTLLPHTAVGASDRWNILKCHG